jgi:hypothetical protein
MAIWSVFHPLVFAIAGAALNPASPIGTAPDRAGELVFPLKEVSVFEIDTNLRGYFVRGQEAKCSGNPCSAVSAYPVFVSKKPLYGSVRFPGQDHLDRSGPEYFFALDESKGTGTGYDLLYFDANRNRDLTDDPPLVSRLPWPTNSILDGAKLLKIKEQVVFPCLSIPLEGSPAGMPALELMPRLMISSEGYEAALCFVTTKAHVGEIQIADRKYTAYLSHHLFISGWFDQPGTSLLLVPHDPEERIWIRTPMEARLASIYWIGDRYWQFSATPAGDRLTARPCPKALGTLEIGSGGRHIRELALGGVLRSKDAVVAFPHWSPEGRWKPVQRGQLPEGDYQPVILNAQYGSVQVLISWNAYRDGMGEEIHRSDVYGIQIRKDRPFVLDLSDKLVVLFASPAPGARVRRGDMLQVVARLVDPRLDIVVEDIRSVPQERMSWICTVLAPILFIAGLAWLVVPRLPRGLRAIAWVPIAASVLIVALLGFNRFVDDWMTSTYCLQPPAPKKLETGAVVTRANGQVVARGDFPLRWSIPKDLDLKGDEEVFTIKASFETQEFCGTVTASRQVTISR